MPQFLNTELINEWLPKVIATAKNELVIVVPYIQLSPIVFSELQKADKRGVRTVLIYRENKLAPAQKAKLNQLQNLNQFEHPSVHCKTLYNGELLLISSMNLYEYSENNNREMGVLFARTSEGSSMIGNSWSSPDEAKVFTDFLFEYKDIQNGSAVVKLTDTYVLSGMKIDILRTPQEKALDLCNDMKKVFGHKQFEPIEYGQDWLPMCLNYFDKLDVGLELERRAFLHFTYPEQRIESIFNRANASIREYLFPGYKFYWNHHTAGIYLYPDSRDRRWQNIDQEARLIEYRKGIDQVVHWLRSHI